MFTSMFCARTGGWSAHILSRSRTGRRSTLGRSPGRRRDPPPRSRAGAPSGRGERHPRDALPRQAGDRHGCRLRHRRGALPRWRRPARTSSAPTSTRPRRLASPGGRGQAVALDVTDAAAVRALVDEVDPDLLFNNAGITFGGETEDLTLERWNAIIDVNIRGVVRGSRRPTPHGRPRGRRVSGGQIVSTASMGGLMAAGLITFVMTKHAVVRLSLALRSEAAAKGVGVTVVCPSAVDTPILDKDHIGPVSTAATTTSRGRGVRHPLDPTSSRRRSRGGRGEPAMLVTPRTARIAWRLGRSSRASSSGRRPGSSRRWARAGGAGARVPLSIQFFCYHRDRVGSTPLRAEMVRLALNLRGPIRRRWPRRRPSPTTTPSPAACVVDLPDPSPRAQLRLRRAPATRPAPTAA